MKLAPPFDATSDQVGTVSRFQPSRDGDDYVVVLWDNGVEARFDQRAIVAAE